MKLFLIISILFSFLNAFAEIVPNQLYTGDTVEAVSLETVASDITPGTIVVLSEIHDSLSHHHKQVDFLKALAEQKPHLSISTGMEFFYYPDQDKVDQFLKGDISESKFLSKIKWGGFPFDFYREQVLFPLSHGGTTIALNAPRFLTKKIAKEGLGSLKDSDRSFLPPNFELGREEYKERFKEVMGNHVPPSALENYFAAQSTWDDTMAWRASEFIKNNPEQVLVMIVGDFHAKYFGGTPDRLFERGMHKVITISQVHLEGLTQEEALEAVGPHPLWGARGDYVWTSLSKEEP